MIDWYESELTSNTNLYKGDFFLRDSKRKEGKEMRDEQNRIKI